MSVHPSKRAEFKAIMKDRWENIGQEEGLSPYVEPGHDTEDPPAALGNDRAEGKMSRQSPTEPRAQPSPGASFQPSAAPAYSQSGAF